VLEASRPLGADCRFLFVSSAEVYGAEATDPMPLREDCPFRPGNPYAASKAAGEMLAIQFHKNYGMPVVRVRPFNHTGPRQSDVFVCSSLARQIAEIDAGIRPPTVSIGSLKLQRDFSDVRDIVRGYHLLLEKGAPGEVYQLCSGQPVALESIVQTLSSLISKPVNVSVDESRARSGEVKAVWGDPSKARQATGWVPQFDLETTLRDLRLYWEKAPATETRTAR
jgi:GDP-4-dehydro-6-deoxy-D-mannose reductase